MLQIVEEGDQRFRFAGFPAISKRKGLEAAEHQKMYDLLGLVPDIPARAAALRQEETRPIALE